MSTPDTWAGEFRSSPGLQHEFLTEAAYVAFKKAESKGLVSIYALGFTPGASAGPSSKPAQADNESMRSAYEARTPAGASIRAEFPNLESFGAYMRALQRGDVRYTRNTPAT